ncbi:D-alanine--D-alanine ligase [Gammaproteobacteria bacterium]|nr:D-alanine--D-alanine ligase [Gammaproteobacteria bacterium]
MAIKKIIVLYGGKSSEREVSLESGKYIFQAVKELGYDAQLIDYPKNFSPQQLTKEDFIFIALHGEDGESGELQKLLQQKCIPFSGSHHQACVNTWNKNTCKELLKDNKIPTPNWITIPSLLEMEKDLDNPFFNQLKPFKELFLKPAEDGSSIDVFKISCNKDLENAICNCADPRRTFILEESIDFKELTVPILNGRCLPAVEIKTSESFYNFNAKYVNEDTQLTELVLSTDDKNKLEKICLKTLDVSGCSGWLRVDLMQDRNNKFYVLEVNTAPGMTSHSLFPKSAESIGLSYNQLVQEIINAN